ncbi:MAG: [LysW]-aminoadipate kinase [Candidatus Dormibacteraeota bacterium]|nr:[LysW]-aminoadipate kinase [Candidatus Dormibacteraeota bacterium]
MSLLVLKIGGSVRDPEPLLHDVAETVPRGERVLLVHGASRDLNELSTALGYPPRMVESGRGDVTRFTDRTTMDHFLMAYAGLANKRIVERLRQLGVNAAGLSGLDGGIVQGRRRADLRVVENGRARVLHDNFVGGIEHVDISLLGVLLERGYTPVLTPPIAAEDGTAINVDGDRLAAEVAIALHADALFIFADTAGILRDPGDEATLVTTVTLDDMDALGLSGRVRPKLHAASRAASHGVRDVRIADGRLAHPLSSAREGSGTTVSRTASSAGSPRT